MQTRALRLAGAISICLLTAVAGCRFPDFRRNNRVAASNSSVGDDISRLSNRQIASVQFSLARSLEQQGDSAQAMEAYREVTRNDPRHPLANWRMAVLHDRQANFAKSESLYRLALKADPKSAEIHCDFGYSLYLQKRWAEAEDHLRRSVALQTEHRRAHSNLGLLLAQTERLDEALVEFRRAGCPDAEAHANLAFVLTLNHRWDAARWQYELALAADPNCAAARAGLESLHRIVAKAAPAGGQLTQAAYENPAYIGPAYAGRATYLPALPQGQ